MERNRNSTPSTSMDRKRSFRDMLQRIEEIQESEDVGVQAIEGLGEIFKAVNSIDDQCDTEERIKYTDETLLESTVLSSASGLLVKCVENLDILPTATYEPAEFANKLLNAIGGPEEANWLTFLEDACSLIPDVPSFAFLSGTFDPSKLPEQKQRKERQKREAQEKVEKKQLQKINAAGKNEAALDDTVSFLLELLTAQYEKKSKPIPYYDFVIDSESFASTVENIFYTSFLLRDGKASIEIDNDGSPVLQPMKQRDLEAFRENGGTNVQMISSITMDVWETLNKKEGIIQKQRKRKMLKK